VGSGREVHGKENPRKHYAVGLRTEPAHLVRGSSRRITIMRFRPANIRVINRRNSRLDRDLRCLLRKDGKKKENKEEGKTKKVLDKVIPYQCLAVSDSQTGVFLLLYNYLTQNYFCDKTVIVIAMNGGKMRTKGE